MNEAFKSRMPEFYTLVIAAMNPGFDCRFALDGGVGGIVERSRRVFFNPELNYRAIPGLGRLRFSTSRLTSDIGSGRIFRSLPLMFSRCNMPTATPL